MKLRSEFFKNQIFGFEQFVLQYKNKYNIDIIKYLNGDINEEESGDETNSIA